MRNPTLANVSRQAVFGPLLNHRLVTTYLLDATQAIIAANFHREDPFSGPMDFTLRHHGGEDVLELG